MVRIATVLIMGFALSILLTTFYSFSAVLAGPESPRLLETANTSDTSENLTEIESESPRLLETANTSDTSENLTEIESEDPRLLETP
jgi:hypothetical protein